MSACDTHFISIYQIESCSVADQNENDILFLSIYKNVSTKMSHPTPIPSILSEYEDTFPFHGELSPLAASHAYSETDIAAILAIAKECSLAVIPLVQTFGHFEFVLKHQQFLGLRCVSNLELALFVFQLPLFHRL